MIKNILATLFLGLMCGIMCFAFLEGLSRESQRLDKAKEYNCKYYGQAMNKFYERNVCD